MSTPGPRSLADQLRRWPDERLRALLVARPDLAQPAPADSSHLASRAATRASVMRAVDQLDRATLCVLEALGILGGRASTDEVAALVHADPAEVRRRLELATDLALVWGEPHDLRLVSAVSDTLATSVSGLGPSLATLLERTGPARVASLLADAGGTPSGDRATDVAALAALLSDPDHVTGLLRAAGAEAETLLRDMERAGAEGRSRTADRDATAATA